MILQESELISVTKQMEKDLLLALSQVTLALPPLIWFVRVVLPLVIQILSILGFKKDSTLDQ